MARVPTGASPQRRRALVGACTAAALTLGALGSGRSAGAAPVEGKVEPGTLQVVSWSRVGPGLEAVVSVPAMLSGRAVPEESFTVAAGAQSVPFSARRLPVDQLDIALVLTADATTAGQASADAIRAATVEFGAALDPGARVAVVAGDPVRIVTPLTAERSASGPALTARGVDPASIEAALRLASFSLGGARRPVVLVVGSGVLSSVGVPAWWPPGLPLYAALADATAASAADVSRNSTGGFAIARQPTAMVSALDAVAADLTSQYRITVPELPGGVADLVIRVRAAEVDSQSTLALAPPVTVSAPPGTVAVGTLPESAPARAVDAARVSADDGGTPWATLVGGAIVLLFVAGAIVIYRRHPRVGAARAGRHAHDGPVEPAPGPDPGAPLPPEEVTIVLAADEHRHRAGGSATREIVTSPVDALRQVIRRHATTLVIEQGTGDPELLVRAVANHDRASGGHTRVIQVGAGGALIDLSEGAAPGSAP